jgi:ADP-ribose pyrophosphatase YjhB (NUDIX family)
VKNDERAERQFLAKYRPEDFPRPSVAVDIVVLTVQNGKLRVLVIARNEHPFKGRWALPGGFLRVGKTAGAQGEDLDAAAARELEEETALTPDEVSNSSPRSEKQTVIRACASSRSRTLQSCDLICFRA